MSTSAPAAPWTTVGELRGQVRKAWTTGDLLRELLSPSGAYPRRRTLKHPTAAQLRDHYPEVGAWAADLAAGAQGKAGYSLEYVTIGRNTAGANQVPAAAVFATVQDEIAFAGMREAAATFGRLAAQLSGMDPLLGGWAQRHPLKLVELAGRALTAGSVAQWLVQNPAPGIYLRQLSLPGVHTKFVEAHRRVIDQMVAVLAPGRATDGADFVARHGFVPKPELVRFRLLDPGMAPFGRAHDVSVTAEAFATLELGVRHVVATENLTNFLALPPVPGTLALYGGGYGFAALADAAWLSHCGVHYWGDLDTHGYRILDQLRAVHPHVQSLMMDEQTLLAHRDFWGADSSQSTAMLTRLEPAESLVYNRLCRNEYAAAVRLEQEHVRWDYAIGKILEACARPLPEAGPTHPPGSRPTGSA
ncbi:Wadjet anti-phage system protein JetD domain-containing protein [Pseudarthrobacter sp. P1]|uniref:Wadjet anti-phage system protein JetD domain-containing protein n=1 Tax=Pseudarthrobacter sp. P1 TaxID=3418418 RepID=UPI003CF1FE66